MQPDPLVAAWAAIKSAAWFIFAAPIEFWRKGGMLCWPGNGCEPITHVIAAGVSWIILFVAVCYLLGVWFNRAERADALRCLVIAVVLLSVNASLLPLWTGLQVVLSRADNRTRAQERWERDHPPPARPYRFPNF